ncbi:16S rRNA (cytosine(1402)-N(4))-methyltransferase RsmH [Longimicrobium sp.]|uniref:16S rRNA (cytosine(1402)-N(4))-methyltransferase RsmH n=1 Tax=Longimicrobium sp. TaxID=2029185 RepID=UPI002E35BCA5|nr:16S rRNA (cytosine(1402)-N(4))-methyltransferase RsmH [Longimicrobium sp.]HEX6037110.1 16S rRNA (cytosine(1402)-N(4))-methyltransferase RsmH [Longimicrobium sp.]
MTLPYASGYHAPVMVRECMDLLQPERGGTFLDGTLGGGGHSEALLERGPSAILYGVDRDPDALAEAGTRLARFGERFRPVKANFADALETAGIADGTLDGVLLDLGISSHQVDVDARGFTFRPGAPLDMRMGQGTADEPTAADLLNEMDEAELANVFYRYGEERRSRKLARVVAEMRDAEPFETSDQLQRAIDRALGARTEIADRARIFQALRIAVNGEIEALERALERFRDALAPGGVFAVMSYHSLEDRLVKNAFRDWSLECVCPPGLPVCRCRGRALGTTLTRKPVSASDEEVAANPRARSARLRGWRAA